VEGKMIKDAGDWGLEMRNRGEESRGIRAQHRERKVESHF